MKYRNPYSPFQVVFIVAFSLLSNFLGRILADAMNLPLWLDSFGTFFTAYCLGPVCGAIVGVAGNILHGLINPISFIYGITSIFIAVIVGILAHRGWMKDILKTMSLSVLVTLVSVVISVVLDFVFYDGDIGNEWGNGIAELFKSWGVNPVVSIILGQFYVDFLDKVITLICLYYFIRIYRTLRPSLPSFFVVPTFSATKNLSSIAIIFFIFAMMFSAPQKSYAQIKNFNSFSHTVYNKENGLSGGKANDIASTNDGILWIGTYEGLYRHNGNEFRLMNEFDSIKAVRCLYVDDEGRLFVGTNDNGISIIINESVMNVLEEKDGLPADAVRCITRASNGLYYVGTAESMAIISIADGLGVEATIPQIQMAKSVSADEKGHIATVNAKGSLFVMKNTSEIFWTSEKTSEKFTSASFSPDGILYVASESNKVFKFSVSDSGVSKISEINCSQLRHINSFEFFNNLVFLCADNGVGYLEKDSLSLLETGAFNNSIDNMTEDYQGNLWFTSSRLGILKMCETSFSEVYASAGLPVSVINSIARFRGNLYFATDDGLMAVDSKTNAALNNDLTRLLSGTRIRCLTSAKDGSLWICTKSKGLLHVVSSSQITTFGSGHQFRVAYELSDGTVVAGASDGIAFIRNGRIIQWMSEKDGLENSVILTLSENHQLSILAGTDGGGLAVIEKVQDGTNASYKISRVIKRTDGLSSNVILRTVNDFDGENVTDGVFVVTSNGLCYVDFSDNSVRLLSNFPFSNNYDLVVHKNKNIFVLSGAGIFVVNRDDLLGGEKLDYELLDLKMGLRGSLTANSWNLLEDNGDLYLSCDTGSSRINLNTYDKVEHSYRMQLKSVIIDGKRHIVQKDIPFAISDEAENIELVPEIINYSINTPYISLFLEGVDEKPTVMLQSELSSVVYSRIKSGSYKFHIAVLDSKGRDVTEEVTYSLTKSFRIFDNWWFKFYAVGVAMLAIAWLTWYITSTLQRRKNEKKENEMNAIKKQLKMGNETIFSIANAVEARDKSTGRHSFRVAEYAVLIAKELGFSEEEQLQIKRIGLLHDIGKIGVPDSVLNKKESLSDEEYQIMKTHTIIGGEILKDFTLIPHVDEGAKFHHERYDGSGYPNGLSGESIPLNARIIGIADAFDAMTADRVYRNALDMDYVVSELKRCSGTQFDPGLVEIMLELIENGTINVEKTFAESSFGEENHHDEVAEK